MKTNSDFQKTENVLRVVEFTDPNQPGVEAFFRKCQELDYVNNVSLKSIKFHWAIEERRGKFWLVQKDDQVIGMAGCHWMPEIHDKAFRIQFRGCELPRMDVKKTLSRSHFNSFTFRELIPKQLRWIQAQGDFIPYITTNHSNRNHRAMELISRQGFLEKHDEGQYFGVLQTAWKFNADYYLDVRSRLKSYAVEA